MRRLFLLVLLVFCAAGCHSQKITYGKWAIGRDKFWFPLQLNAFTVSVNGFTDALIEQIAKEQDVPMQIVDANWIDLFQRLDEQEYGGVLSPIPVNLISESKFSFSEPLILLGPQLIVPINSAATSLDDLSGKIVGVNQYDESVLIVENYPSIIIQPYQNMPSALDDLAQGLIDGVLMPTLQAKPLISKQYAQVLKIVTPPLNDKAIRLVTLKDQNKDLLDHFNRGLQDLRATSSYGALRKKFGLD